MVSSERVTSSRPAGPRERCWSRRSCHHGPRSADAAARENFTMALLGMPNTGKSTFDKRLTGGHAQIANWPGLTVELLRGAMPPDRLGQADTVVDLPGIHDLTGSSDDEAVVQRVMRNGSPDLLLVVLNASQISSQIRLLLPLQTLGLPMVAVLNMSDEARSLRHRDRPCDHGG